MLQLWQVGADVLTYKRRQAVQTEYTVAVTRWDGKVVIRETFSRREAAAHIQVSKDLDLPYAVRLKSKIVQLGWYPQCILCDARDCEFDHAHCDNCCNCPDKDWPF